MLKGVFNEDGNANRMYRHFLQMPFQKVLHRGGGFGVSNIFSSNYLKKSSIRLKDDSIDSEKGV